MQGYKTYLCVGLGLLVIGAHAAGFLTDDQSKMFIELLGFSGIAALRAAVGRS